MLWLGRTCAARAMGAGLKELRAAIQVAADEAREAELREWRARDAAWQAYLDAATGRPRDEEPWGRWGRGAQIEALGGYRAARAGFEAARADRT